ncbi:TRAP transporter small permease [candidate division KSB1 bacterium]|nr:TRAP transporter small permease [candidate division KSB1 bacterium]
MRFLKQLDHWISIAENALLIFLLTLMILLAFLQIPLTRIYPIQDIDILLRHLVLWVSFFGATLATREERHINIDVMSKLLKGRWKALSGVFINLFGTVVCILLFSAAIKLVDDSKRFEETVSIFTTIPAWSLQSIFLIGFGLMIFRFAIKTLEKSYQFFTEPKKKR